MTVDRLEDNGTREQLWRDVLVQVRTNVQYQQYRRNILERRENLVKVVSVVLASGAFLDVKGVIGGVLTQTPPNPPPVGPGSGGTAMLWIAVPLLGIVFANVWGLVFQWGAKSRDAAKRFDSWTAFEASVHKVGLVSFDEDDLRRWNSEMIELETGEPKVNTYLARRAEREARRILQNPRASDVAPARGLDWARRIFSNFMQYVPRLFVALP